jgi:outer membrane protein assembly factor BamB
LVAVFVIIVCTMLVLVACGPTTTTPAPSSTSASSPTSTPALTPQETPVAATNSTPVSSPTPAPATNLAPATTIPPDTTPPPATTGLIANNAYDGRINVWWHKTTATDFDHYNIYLNKTKMADVTGMKAAQQIKDIAECRYQATGLDDGTQYYVAVTAVDKSGNEDVRVTCVSATPMPMPRGTVDTAFSIDLYQPERVWAGTTLLALNHETNKHRIIEVNMLGEVVWEYVVPGVPAYSFVEAELLANNHILYTIWGKGVYEIDRSGKVVWQYLTSKIDHDADRLPNGNTIFVFGMGDRKSDPQVVEVDPDGQVVWTWYAKDYFDKSPYNDIYDEGWAHTNAVSRLANGNTLISPRNFNLVVEVNPKGEVVRTIGDGIFHSQHDPEMLPNGNIIAALQYREMHKAAEFDPNTGKIVWQYLIPDKSNFPVRDANRLPNDNTLITGSTEIVEVTLEGEIVWRLRLQGVNWPLEESAIGLYKADRISAQK